MTILELLTLEKPFAEYNEMAAARAAEKGRRPQRPTIAFPGIFITRVSDEIWSLLEMMWNQDAASRLSAGDVLKRLIIIRRLQTFNVGEDDL